MTDLLKELNEELGFLLSEPDVDTYSKQSFVQSIMDNYQTNLMALHARYGRNGLIVSEHVAQLATMTNKYPNLIKLNFNYQELYQIVKEWNMAKDWANIL